MQDGRKAVWSIPYVSLAPCFPSLKQNFIAYCSSKVSSRPDCIFEIHQLWQSGYCMVYSNCCCSCSFEQFIKIGQWSHTEFSRVNDNFKCPFEKSLETYRMPHVYIYICVCVCVCVCVDEYVWVSIFVVLFLCSHVLPSVYLNILISFYLLFIYMSVGLSVWLNLFQSTYLFSSYAHMYLSISLLVSNLSDRSREWPEISSS